MLDEMRGLLELIMQDHFKLSECTKDKHLIINRLSKNMRLYADMLDQTRDIVCDYPDFSDVTGVYL
jgi:hypothetical protein